MGKLELQIGYIADAIIEAKKKRFHEDFTTIEEVDVIKQVMQKRVQRRNLKVTFVDGFFERYFEIVNGIITKSDKAIISLKSYISNMEISETIYDEHFIYLCLCEMFFCKLNNSIEHTCSNCVAECTGLFQQSHYEPNDCPRWAHDFRADCVANISISERLFIEESSLNKRLSRKLVNNSSKSIQN